MRKNSREKNIVENIVFESRLNAKRKIIHTKKWPYVLPFGFAFFRHRELILVLYGSGNHTLDQ